MGSAADRLREERRKVLGDWAAFCLRCGAARRWFEASESELPSACPGCGGELLRRCRACGSPFQSAFALACEVCGATLRGPEVGGVRIRRAVSPEPPP